MNCRELERLFVSAAPESAYVAHSATCPACAALKRDLDRAAGMIEGLQPAAWPAGLRSALLGIPRSTVSCEAAGPLIAAAQEEELPATDGARLQSHLSRCGGCSEAVATLAATRSLDSPLPSPWLFQRVALARPTREKAPAWRRIFRPRLVVAYAYAAAVVAMIAGFNPADIARAGTGLQENTRTAAAAVRGSAADRLGELQEEIARTFAIVKGKAGGYGRAALSNAMALIMKEESNRPPARPRNGEEGGTSKQDETTQTMTWRA